MNYETWVWFQQSCRTINRNRYFQLLMLIALIMVLFLPDMWVIFDMEHNGDLDVLLCLVLLLFITELAVQMIGMPKTYINSFFFWMDVIGLLSVPLDHSLVSDSLPRSFDNAVVMRAARTARLGARAGRFSKLMKLLRFLPGVHQESGSGSFGTAKTMSNTLITSLSTRVSCLIIVLVIILPLFEMATYPEADYSMKTWLRSLDFALRRYPASFDQRLKDFEAFYINKDYYPIEVMFTFVNGTYESQRLSGRRPRRKTNQMVIQADSSQVKALFNFGPQKRIDATCNVALIGLIIILMAAFSLLLSNSVSAIVLQPLERLLCDVKKMASKIFRSVSTMAAKCDVPSSRRVNDQEMGTQATNETELLEKVIDKLAALSAITLKASPMDAETLEQLGESDRKSNGVDSTPTIHIQTTRESTTAASENWREQNTSELVSSLEMLLEEAGMTWGTFDSWDFNVVDLEDQQRQLLSMVCLIFHLGVGYTSSLQTTLVNFVEAAASGYGNPAKVPYHSWNHAVDVTHCIFRLMHICGCERFLSTHERFALVVSAVCHDIGHPGLNNPFLIETSHELAIRYNDNSPLENMHCARLFEIINQPNAAVFAHLDQKQYREVRLVCIEAILHTDNIHHFTMVKELQMLYEMNADIFDLALQMSQTQQFDFPPKDISDLFTEPDRKKLMRNLFLHFCDVSNPTKPFPICKTWAWLIIDEFFLQGDKEKEIGIAVQPLNDRSKVSRPIHKLDLLSSLLHP